METISNSDTKSPSAVNHITKSLVDAFDLFLTTIGLMAPEDFQVVHRYLVELGLHLKTQPFDPKNEELRAKLRRYAAVEILFACQLFEFGELHKSTFAGTPESDKKLADLHAHIVTYADENKARYDNPNVRQAEGLEGLLELIASMGESKQ